MYFIKWQYLIRTNSSILYMLCLVIISLNFLSLNLLMTAFDNTSFSFTVQVWLLLGVFGELEETLVCYRRILPMQQIWCTEQGGREAGCDAVWGECGTGGGGGASVAAAAAAAAAALLWLFVFISVLFSSPFLLTSLPFKRCFLYVLLHHI